MIVEIKAQHSRPSPPYGSIQIRLFRVSPNLLLLNMVWLYPTVWVR